MSVGIALLADVCRRVQPIVGDTTPLAGVLTSQSWRELVEQKQEQAVKLCFCQDEASDETKTPPLLSPDTQPARKEFLPIGQNSPAWTVSVDIWLWGFLGFLYSGPVLDLKTLEGWLLEGKLYA